MSAGYRTGFGGDFPAGPSGQPAALRHRLGSHVGIVIAAAAMRWSLRKAEAVLDRGEWHQPDREDDQRVGG